MKRPKHRPQFNTCPCWACAGDLISNLSKCSRASTSALFVFYHPKTIKRKPASHSHKHPTNSTSSCNMQTLPGRLFLSAPERFVHLRRATNGGGKQHLWVCEWGPWVCGWGSAERRQDGDASRAVGSLHRGPSAVVNGNSTPSKPCMELRLHKETKKNSPSAVEVCKVKEFELYLVLIKLAGPSWGGRFR